MRVSFERQLNEMHDKLVEMFSFVEKSLKDSSKALITKDKDLAREIIKRDKITDEMEIEKLRVNAINSEIEFDFNNIFHKQINSLESISKRFPSLLNKRNKNF